MVETHVNLNGVKVATEMHKMLEMSRLNDEKVWINPDQIKMIFSSPDTTLVFSDGSSLAVKDSVQDIEKRWVQFRRNIVHQEKPQ